MSIFSPGYHVKIQKLQVFTSNILDLKQRASASYRQQNYGEAEDLFQQVMDTYKYL
jgi:tetratricopeptide (TPR) repeat protein